MKEKALNKELGLFGIFCVATGAMISSGLFILPGLAFSKAGPAVIISYILAGILAVPALLSNAELITAMPKAGGDYFYIMRGFGPLLGTMAGMSSWFSLSLKGAFALIGMGAYLGLITDIPINYIAILCCLIFIALNLLGVKEAGRLQVFLVVALLSVLALYVICGFRSVDYTRFTPFFSRGITGVFATTSFVFISYGGLTKIAALAEDVRNPGKTLPLGMILSLAVTMVVYSFVIFVTTGVMDPDVFKTTIIPISEGAGAMGAAWLKFAVSIAAFLAFISTANATIMTASRYPLGMSRDKLIPPLFQRVTSAGNVPYVSIMATGAFMVFALLFLNLEFLVKVASSILLLLFIFANLTVILFRESRIMSYRPKFYSPFYPYIQIAGIAGGLFLLIEMGSLIIFLMSLFLLAGYGWFRFYGERKAVRDSALIYALEKLVAKDRELTSDNLLVELKDIVIERDRIVEDKFHRLIKEAHVLDIDDPVKMEDFFEQVSGVMAGGLGYRREELKRMFIEREMDSSTVLRQGLAIPHVVINGRKIFKVFMARARGGVIFPGDKLAHIIFVLAGSRDERNLHLKVLAAIAQVTETPGFDQKWMAARNADELKNIVLLVERKSIV